MALVTRVLPQNSPAQTDVVNGSIYEATGDDRLLGDIAAIGKADNSGLTFDVLVADRVVGTLPVQVAANSYAPSGEQFYSIDAEIPAGDTLRIRNNGASAASAGDIIVVFDIEDLDDEEDFIDDGPVI